jgi:archaellum component FlaG (FlaF/FlaG flagellin family)
MHCIFSAAAGTWRWTVRHHISRLALLTGLVVGAIAGWPSEAAAQRYGYPYRSHVVIGVGFGFGGYYGYPFYPYYNPWFYSAWYPWGGWGPYAPYGPYYGPYGYGYPYFDDTGSVRLEVTPRETEVFVDGYSAGTVDRFDGFFQRLRLGPGEHEVVLYLNGYRTVRQHVYLTRGSDQKVRYSMVPLAPGEAAEPRPTPPPEPPPDQPSNPSARPRGGPPGPPPGPRPPQRPGPSGVERPGPSGVEALPQGNFGSVAVRVQPADADVLIDGERWSAPSTQERLVVQLSEGRHHVEVRKDGYEQYSSDVQVRRGETVNVNVSLLKRQ